VSPALRLLGEQGGVIFLHKPAGQPVFPPRSAALRGAGSLLESWLAARPEQGRLGWPPGFEGGIAHRLDNATSGLVLACATPAVLRHLRQQFSEGRLRKRYRFVSRRDVAWSQHRVQLPLAHDRRHRARMVVKRGASTPHRGRWFPADTQLRRAHGGAWEAVITTGVTHQVRLHAAFVGLALAGDRLYGGGPPPAGLSMPAGAGFLLHHVQVVAPGWSSPVVEPPAWWGPYAG